MDPNEFANLTDEQIMSMAAPPAPAGEAVVPPVEQAVEQANPEVVQDTPAQVTEEEGTPAETGAEGTPEDDPETPKTTEAETGKTTEGGDTLPGNDGEQLGEEGKPTSAESAKQTTPKEEVTTDSTKTTDYKAFYEAALAPIKANGKTYEMKSPDDLRALAQQGLNYTQKMQQIAPIRKIGMMLQNHGLLDEGKLSYLIDLHNRKPEAIKKLIKDAGIDPLEIDTSTDPQYTPSNHGLDDTEVTFRTTLEDLRSSQEGQEVVNLINSTWDAGSKNALWTNPQIMNVIAQHKAAGIYDRVSAEVDRRRALGHVPAEIPFIQAYQAIGDEMGKAGQLNDLVPAATAPVAQAPKQPIATKTITKKPDPNAEKVAAAAAAKANGKPAVAVKNPLDMSDAEFEQALLAKRGY